MEIPLDGFLKIDNLPFKMTKMAMLESAEFGQFSSYASAEQLMREHTHIHISASLIEKVTDYIGSYVYNNDTKRANEDLKSA
jgi:hypothetical protein